MAFINEFVPQDEIEKYGFDELWNHYHPFSVTNMPELRLIGNYKHYWTIDREHDCWLMCFGPVMSDEHSRWLEPTNELIFILHWQGQNIEFRLARDKGNSPNFECVPYRKIWQLLSLEPENLKQSVLPILKQALTVFGYDGIYKQIPNTIVEFKF